MTAPQGCTPAAMSGDNVIELTCDQCAASVAVLAAGRHSNWHREVLTRKSLIGALTSDVEQQGRQIAKVLTTILTDLGHDPYAPDVRAVIDRRLEDVVEHD